MTSIIEKRRSLHKNLAEKQEQNSVLKMQLEQLQALANIGTSTCMIAHEINNLLTPLASYTALALKNREDNALTEKALEKAAKNCERASTLMESILAVANGETQGKRQVRLLSSVEEIFACLCRDFKKDGITVKIRIPEDLTVQAIPVQLQQVLMNLILNARDSMLLRGGILTINAKENAEAVEIEVSDSGCGIAPGDLPNIFEPFFTTKSNGKGTSENSGSGLGLAFCKKVVDSFGGSISVESNVGTGSTFRVSVPKQ